MNSALEPGAYRVDQLRAALAQRRDLTALRASYKAGAYPELADLSSTPLWDDLASCDDTPEFRSRRLRSVARQVPRGAKVLDIGVGWGEIIPMLRERGVTDYAGIDFSAKIIEQARARHPKCRFFVGGLDQLPETFDVVLALEVCEHILAHRVFDLYGEIKRLLRPDGTLFISVPSYEDLKASVLRCPKCGHLHSRMGHVRSYTPELIVAELNLAGFGVAESFAVYASFANSPAGRVKLTIADFGRRLLGLGRTPPLGVVLRARPGTRH